MKISKLGYFLLGVVILILIGVFWWTKKSVLDLVVNHQNNNQPSQTSWRCLKEGEMADYPLQAGTREELGIPTYPLTIQIKDKKSNEFLSSFTIENIKENYHPVELRRCGIYVIKLFNYNPKTAQQAIGYRVELWRYDYSGNGIKSILLNEIGKTGDFIGLYNSDFRIDPKENYVILERGYLGKDDYALVVKDLNTKQDVFTLPYQSIFEKNPKFLGAFGMREWTKDGRYFWADIFEAARMNGFVRIDTKKREYELFEVPDGLMGGEKLNVETGWVTYHTDLVWTGVHEMQEEIKQERRQQGVGTKFYLYNLFTKKKILVYETKEPLFFTQPKWISENEVEYKVESGERRVYRF